jgi:hypothetical protein
MSSLRDSASALHSTASSLHTSLRGTASTLHGPASGLHRSAVALSHTAVGTVRKHSQMSLVAGAVAAAGVLGAAGFTPGTTPWSQAVSNVAKSAPGGAHSVYAQPDYSLFAAVTSGNAMIRVGGADDIRSAAVAGSGAAAKLPAQPAKPAQARPKAATEHAAKPAAPKRQAPERPAAKRPAVKRPAAKPKPAAPAKQYLIYDSVQPSTIPSGKAAAVYANGSYAASSSQVSGHHSVLWIDTNGSDPGANVLDVEPGDATPAGAEQWVKQRLSSQPHSTAIVYTMMSDWQQVKADVGDLPGWMQSQVRYWIADPTGVPHVVPGSSATQWYWGSRYDITTANPNF